MRLLVTDLDNTLYDWVTFFARSFGAMVRELSALLGVEEKQLLAEFKAVHQRYRNSEQPFAVLELPSVRNRYPEATRSELVDYLAGPLEAFNSTREKTLQLYPGVRTTLARLQAEGFKIVGYTDAIFYNSYYRLVKLDIAQYLAHLYVLESFSSDHPKPDRPRKLVAPEGFAISVPLAERKPNPRLLLDVCHNERIGPAETIYVGDSITNDVAMALQAGVCAVWARYGRSFDPEYWKLLVEISHWTEDEVRRESELRKMFAHVHPDYVIDSFSQLLGLFGLTDQMSDE